MTISLENLIDSLRAPRKTPLTNLAESLRTAQTMRRPKPAQDEEALKEVIGHGYTRAQSLAGGFQSGLRANRHALRNHFAAALPYMASQHWHGLIRQTMDAIASFGVESFELEAICDQHNYQERDLDGLTAEEHRLWQGYVNHGTKWLMRQTTAA